MVCSARRVLLAATVLLASAAVLFAHECMSGHVSRPGRTFHYVSGMSRTGVLRVTYGCPSGQCGMRIFNDTSDVKLKFFCSDPIYPYLARDWKISEDEYGIKTALFICGTTFNQASSPCNDPDLIFNVHGEDKRANEEAFSSIGYGLVLDVPVVDDVPSTTAADVDQPSEESDDAGDTPASTVTSDKAEDTPANQPIDDGDEGTTAAVSPATIEETEQPDVTESSVDPTTFNDDAAPTDAPTVPSTEAVADTNEAAVAPDGVTDPNGAADVTAADPSDNDTVALIEDPTSAGPTTTAAAAGLPLAVVAFLSVLRLF